MNYVNYLHLISWQPTKITNILPMLQIFKNGLRNVQFVCKDVKPGSKTYAQDIGGTQFSYLPPPVTWVQTLAENGIGLSTTTPGLDSFIKYIHYRCHWLITQHPYTTLSFLIPNKIWVLCTCIHTNNIQVHVKSMSLRKLELTPNSRDQAWLESHPSCLIGS